MIPRPIDNECLESESDIKAFFTNQALNYQRQQDLLRISNFNHEFSFLNNAFESQVYYQGIFYKNVFTAFQAARSDIEQTRLQLSACENLQQVYEKAIQIPNPEDWQ